jgi:hypothetical protein
MANQIASLNIDSLRACSIAELNEVAREHFGIELHGNKPQRLKTLEDLIRRAQNSAVAETVTEQDVTLRLFVKTSSEGASKTSLWSHQHGHGVQEHADARE